MQKVHIIGKLKTIKKEYFKTIKETIKYDKVGWLKDKVLFYPDKNNSREFYKIISHASRWDKGILYSKLEYIDENAKVEVESTCEACKPKEEEETIEEESTIEKEEEIEEVKEEKKKKGMNMNKIKNKLKKRRNKNKRK